MTFTETCEVCKAELKDKFVWVSCRYWNSHPTTECNGGCEYPVGLGCAKHIPKEFVGKTMTIQEWYDEMEKYNEVEE